MSETMPEPENGQDPEATEPSEADQPLLDPEEAQG